jgi:hypothetical protein
MPSLTLHLLVLVVINPNKKHTISEVKTIENHFDTDIKELSKINWIKFSFNLTIHNKTNFEPVIGCCIFIF